MPTIATLNAQPFKSNTKTFMKWYAVLIWIFIPAGVMYYLWKKFTEPFIWLSKFEDEVSKSLPEEKIKSDNDEINSSWAEEFYGN